MYAAVLCDISRVINRDHVSTLPWNPFRITENDSLGSNSDFTAQLCRSFAWRRNALPRTEIPWRISIPLRKAVKRARIRATFDVSPVHLPYRVTSLPSSYSWSAICSYSRAYHVVLLVIGMLKTRYSWLLFPALGSSSCSLLGEWRFVFLIATEFLVFTLHA